MPAAQHDPARAGARGERKIGEQNAVGIDPIVEPEIGASAPTVRRPEAGASATTVQQRHPATRAERAAIRR